MFCIFSSFLPPQRKSATFQFFFVATETVFVSILFDLCITNSKRRGCWRTNDVISGAFKAGKFKFVVYHGQHILEND